MALEMGGLRAKKIDDAWRIVVARHPREIVEQPAIFRGPFKTEADAYAALLSSSDFDQRVALLIQDRSATAELQAIATEFKQAIIEIESTLCTRRSAELLAILPKHIAMIDDELA